MKISILITNKDYGSFLAAAIDSALAQDYEDVEIIIVDDGSSDNSHEIINSYGDRITAVFGHYGGQIPATNAAFARATGDLIIFLDSDDVLRNDTATRFQQALASGESVKVSGYLRIISAEGVATGETIPKRLTPAGRYRDRLVDEGPGVYRAAFNSGNGWTREFLDQVMPIPETSKIGPDGYLNLICPLFGATASIDDWVAEYRIHGRNMGPYSRRFTIPWLERIDGQLEASWNYLADWIHRTDGPDDARRRWRHTWRSRLIRHCLYRMTRKQKYRESIPALVVAPFKSVETRTPRALMLAPMLLATACLPRSMAMELARRLLGLKRTDSGSSHASTAHATLGAETTAKPTQAPKSVVVKTKSVNAGSVDR